MKLTIEKPSFRSYSTKVRLNEEEKRTIATKSENLGISESEIVRHLIVSVVPHIKEKDMFATKKAPNYRNSRNESTKVRLNDKEKEVIATKAKELYVTESQIIRYLITDISPQLTLQR